MPMEATSNDNFLFFLKTRKYSIKNIYAGKKKKENGKDPSHYRIHFMIPEDEN